MSEQTNLAPYLDDYFKVRFPFDPRRDVVWREVCRYLQAKHFPKAESIVDLGAGYCNFINNVTGTNKHAVDVAPIIEEYAADDVTTHLLPCTDLGHFEDDSFDVAFASNLFEHLSLDDLTTTLQGLFRILRPGGKLIAMQPNFKYCYKTYFDDYTHTHVYTHQSLPDLMETVGFTTEHVVPNLLPVNMKSTLRLGVPRLDLVVRFYLRSPIRPLAAQMLVVMKKPSA